MSVVWVLVGLFVVLCGVGRMVVVHVGCDVNVRAAARTGVVRGGDPPIYR